MTDVRLSVRGLSKAPLVLIVTVLSLGAGIGVVTIAFALVNEVVVRPPTGLAEPEDLVTVYRSQPEGGRFGSTSYADYLDVDEALDALDAVAAISIRNIVLDGPSQSRSLLGEAVSGNYFQVTGIRPVVGRVFTAEEATGDAAPRVVVLGHDVWTQGFEASPDVIGASVRLNGRPYTVIGVAPDGVNSRRVPLEADLWVPLGSLDEGGLLPDGIRTQRNQRDFTLFARLATDASIEDVQAQADVLSARLRSAYPDTWDNQPGEGQTLHVWPESESRINPRARALFMAIGAFFVGATSLILLLACANVTGLFLARARRRRSELAVRISIGASRGRIVRMMLAEGLLPGLAAGVLGVGIAVAGVGAIGSATLPIQLPVRLDAELTPLVLAFALALSVAASLVFSLLPALSGSKPDLLGSLKEGSEGWSGRRGRSLSVKNGLVVVQCAASAILLVGATLFLKTLALATEMDLGFDSSNIAVATKQLDMSDMDARGGAQYIRDLRSRMGAEAGVSRVAMARSLELTLFQMGMQVEVSVPGRDGTPELEPAFRNAVTPGYLEMLDVPLLRGRTITEADTEDARRVAVVNQTFADRYWPGEDAIGRSFSTESEEEVTQVEVVGVMRDGKYQDFDDGPTAYFWTSIYQDFVPHFAIVVEGEESAEAMLPILRNGIDRSDGEMQMVAPSILDDQVSIQFIHLRVASSVLGWGGLFGLFLACIGIYGIVGFAVTQRSREMAIRLALGADRSEVMRSVAFDGLKLAGLGLGVGVAIALPTAMQARSVLYGVSPLDPMAVGGSMGLLVLVSAAASLVPARRVTRIDPMGTLRSE